MKRLAVVVALVGSTAGWAQRRFSAHIGPPVVSQGVGGFGNILFPGTPAQSAFPNPFSFPSTFATRLGATISGFPGFTGAPSGPFLGRGRGAGTVIVPYAYPVYMGGYGYGEPYGQQPNITIVMPPQSQTQAVPPVTINQNFVPQTAKPIIRNYGPGTEEQQQPGEASAAPEESSPQTYRAPTPNTVSQDQVLFFIALKDSTIYTAVAYWVEDGTLNYITPQGKHNQVSLDLVDRALSAKLNQGRQVDFQLPPATQK